MELCHTDLFLHSPAAQRLLEFIRKRREKWATQPDLCGVENFEQELHTLVMALECEELSQYDIREKDLEVDGQVYHRSVRLPETYLTAAGQVTVECYWYYPVVKKGESICPLELHSGIIAGYFTSRAARQGAFAMAHLTSGESEALFGEIGNMQPSRSSLDRLTKALSPHWEAQLRQAETVPEAACIMAISVDGGMAPLRGVAKQEMAEPAAPADTRKSAAAR